MDFKYLDAFARPGASKSYEKKPETKAPSIDKIITDAQIAQINLAKARMESASRAADRALARSEASVAAMEKKQVPKSTTDVFNATVDATPKSPSTPAAASVAPAVSVAVKTAPIDTILFNDDSVSIDVMTDLLFENIGGHELINIARNDIINGQKVSYQPIKNISSIQQQYNSNNILGLQNTSDKYFSNFSIKLENKIPNIGSGPNQSNVYLDSQTGDLIIEAVNMENDEQIEIEITIGATIYEAEFGEIIS